MIQTVLEIGTHGPGLAEITDDVVDWVRSTGADAGLLTVFVRHTSCSLLVQENADPAVQADLQAWLARAVPRSDDPAMSYLTHTQEGSDDMPAHIKAAFLPVSLSIPVTSGKPVLGTWQGLFLWEHRDRPRRREVVLHLV